MYFWDAGSQTQVSVFLDRPLNKLWILFVLKCAKKLLKSTFCRMIPSPTFILDLSDVLNLLCDFTTCDFTNRITWEVAVFSHACVRVCVSYAFVTWSFYNVICTCGGLHRVFGLTRPTHRREKCLCYHRRHPLPRRWRWRLPRWLKACSVCLLAVIRHFRLSGSSFLSRLKKKKSSLQTLFGSKALAIFLSFFCLQLVTCRLRNSREIHCKSPVGLDHRLCKRWEISESEAKPGYFGFAFI